MSNTPNNDQNKVHVTLFRQDVHVLLNMITAELEVFEAVGESNTYMQMLRGIKNDLYGALVGEKP